MNSLKNKVAIITGASRGIGEATARLFVSQGLKVTICGRHHASITKVAETINTENNNDAVLPIAADLSHPEAIQYLFEESYQHWGKLDILINNAAVVKAALFKNQSPEDWDTQINTNIKGPLQASHWAFKQMTNGGSIINISSIAGIRSAEKFPGLCVYSMTKHAIVGMTECLAVEGKLYNIRVNAVAPGAVETQMLTEAAPDLKTNTKPSDIANTIYHLTEAAQLRGLTGTIMEAFIND